MAGSPSRAEYYHWGDTDRNAAIYMQAGMADRLQAEILGNAEVGGILLGRVEDDRGKPVTVIDDFVPVPCAYRGGSLFTLDGEDTVNLEAALLRTALAGSDSPDMPSIIGYYRSHLRDGLSLSPDDLAVIESYFQAPSSVFLVVKPVAGTQACTAGFFFWEDGRIEPEFASLKVALGRHDADDVAAAPTPPVQAPPAWREFLFRAAIIAIATTALVISVVTYLGAPRPPREAAADSMPASILGLQVERNPPDLLVTWNRNAREIVLARRAVLSMRDGRAEKTVDLDKAQLASGSYLYTPASDEIQFRLEVYGADDGSVAQSIRISGGSAR
jgi:hypothetical protein